MRTKLKRPARRLARLQPPRKDGPDDHSHGATNETRLPIFSIPAHPIPEPDPCEPAKSNLTRYAAHGLPLPCWLQPWPQSVRLFLIRGASLSCPVGVEETGCVHRGWRNLVVEVRVSLRDWASPLKGPIIAAS